MERFGITFDLKVKPALDPDFMPLYRWEEAYLAGAKEPLAVALEREDGKIAVIDTRIYGTADMHDADCFYAERLVKYLLWAKGGFRVIICGNEAIYRYVRDAYSKDGARAFDFKTMGDVYEHPFTVEHLPYDERPAEKDASQRVGGHLDGCRIGFDAGGSDRKVSAVIDGKPVFSEEVVWFPKTNSDPEYHFQGIVDALKTAASKMPRVDAVGVSSAGIFINDRTRLSSLFLKVSPEDFDAKVKDIFIRAAKELGDIPVQVANDGDVTALAGAMGLNDTGVLGIAMGTSEAGGYVDRQGNVTGWLNELAFTPVDAAEGAAVDEWSGDTGCGVKYFSQDAVIKLAPKAGIYLNAGLSPAEKLKVVQTMANEGDESALDVFRSIGTYLGHTVPLYAKIYDLKHLLILGRVTSGKGGDVLLAECKRVLKEEYPALCVNVQLPDEKTRRVGQSVAAAGLPAIR